MHFNHNVFTSLNMILAVALGAFVGVFFPNFTESISGIDGVLSNLLKMCVVPIVVSSLIVEITSFLKSTQRSSIKKFIALSLGTSLAIALFAAAMSIVFQPGEQIRFTKESSVTDKIVKTAIVERKIDEPIEKKSKENFFDFFEKAVPKNIFNAFGQNKTFQIILFTIIFSFALSSIPRSEVLENFFEATHATFLKIFTYALLFLPILVFTSTSLSISRVGFQIFLDMFPFLKILFLQLGIVFVVNMLILRHVLKMPIPYIFRKLQTSMLVAFSGSTLAATFPALDFFKKLGETNKQFMTIIAPISMFLNRFGSILYFCFACFFIAQIYGHSFTYEQALFIIAFSIIGGISSAGSTGGVTGVFLISMLDPVDIPAGQVVMILSGLDFLVAPFLAIITVQTNITVLSFLLKNKKQPKNIR